MACLVFQARLRAARDRWDWTQHQLAEAAGLSRGTISHYESGVSTPSLRNFDLLVSALGVSPDYLLGYSDFPQRSS